MEDKHTQPRDGGNRPSEGENTTAAPMSPSSVSSGSLYSGDEMIQTPMETTDEPPTEFPQLEVDSPPLDDESAAPSEQPSTTNLGAAYRGNVSSPGNAPAPLRVVTPDPTDGTSPHSGISHIARNQHSSPRSIPGNSSRRQGIVFHDEYDEDEGFEGNSPPLRMGAGSTRKTRTRTIDTPFVNQRSAPPEMENRHRVGSQSSSGSYAEDPRPMDSVLSSMYHDTQGRGKGKDKEKEKDKKASKRLLKQQQQGSRPRSPHILPPPSVDALPLPMRATDPRKMILLMNTLCGKMKGEVEYQSDSQIWYTGMAYIDEDKFCLMLDSGQNGSFHIPLIFDLRGCRVLPVEYPEERKTCIELLSLHPSVCILLRPLIRDDFDFWLAALLCWQQVHPPTPKASNGQAVSPIDPIRPDLKRHGKSVDGKPTAIIKVGGVSLWDKGLAQSARSLVKRSPTRDVRSPYASWRSVSCTLHDNGDMRLFIEHDDVALAVIELSQLSRAAVQELDPSVLDEEHCLAIFPHYAPNSNKMSILRPIYIALENRVQFEVWFVLLRAFCAPDIYQLHNRDEGIVQDVEDFDKEYEGNMEVFRFHKMIKVMVIEAKVRATPWGYDAATAEKGAKKDVDPLEGNYLAEVVLGDTVRARTTIQTCTKKPFWREPWCEFSGVPHSTESFSVVLKRVEGNLESISNQLQASYGLPKMSNIQERVWGLVKVDVRSLAKEQEHEQWVPILDEKQQTIGSMRIKVLHNDHVILLYKEYNEISEILHQFSNGLTTLISSVTPGQLRVLSEMFLNIFQVSQSASDWLKSLVEDEIDGIGQQATVKYRFGSRLKSSDSIDSTSDRELIVRDMKKDLSGEANLLFRGNTLLTQSLEFHMRRLGNEFLKETLQAKIFEINEINPDCEVDPTKKPHDIDQHWNQLILLTTEIWQCIAAAVNRIPPELRQILKYIRAVAGDRYGDFLRTTAYTSVSGFLFLRFICPAILSPKLFGLLRDHPRVRAQRTFTLVAKALQKLANLSTFGRREEWMEPMNKFLNAQKPKFKEYIDQVCDLPADRLVNALPANYSTPLTILGRLPPIAREGFPSLPYLIDPAYSFAALLKLWYHLDPLAKVENPDSELVKFNALAKKIIERSVACRGAAESRTTEDTAENELVELLEQATIIESLNLSSGNTSGVNLSSQVYHAADQSYPGSSGSDGPEESKIKRRRSRDIRKPAVFGGPAALTPAASKASDKEPSDDKKHNPGSIKARNVPRVGKILNGIMRIGGRAESPEGKSR